MFKKIKTTITLAPHIKEFAAKEASALGLDFSAYITVLIAEKMRSTMLAPSTNNVTDGISDEKLIDNKDIIEIDSEQENEIDRLLQW